MYLLQINKKENKLNSNGRYIYSIYIYNIVLYLDINSTDLFFIYSAYCTHLNK
jgi:hypothetical protein